MHQHTAKAKTFFDEARNSLHPEKDALTWNLMSGLSELCEAIDELHADVMRLRTQIQSH